MPRIKAAKKKLRQDLKRTKANARIKIRFTHSVKKMALKPNAKKLKETIALVDKAAKKGIIAKNKAARIKSRLNSKVKK